MGIKVPFSDFDWGSERFGGQQYSGDLRFCRVRGVGAEGSTGSCAFGNDGTAEGCDIGFVGASEGQDIDAAVSQVSVFEKKRPTWVIIFWPRDNAWTQLDW